jgi:hypothetical protein
VNGAFDFPQLLNLHSRYRVTGKSDCHTGKLRCRTAAAQFRKTHGRDYVHIWPHGERPKVFESNDEAEAQIPPRIPLLTSWHTREGADVAARALVPIVVALVGPRSRSRTRAEHLACQIQEPDLTQPPTRTPVKTRSSTRQDKETSTPTGSTSASASRPAAVSSSAGVASTSAVSPSTPTGSKRRITPTRVMDTQTTTPPFGGTKNPKRKIQLTQDTTTTTPTLGGAKKQKTVDLQPIYSRKVLDGDDGDGSVVEVIKSSEFCSAHDLEETVQRRMDAEYYK